MNFWILFSLATAAAVPFILIPLYILNGARALLLASAAFLILLAAFIFPAAREGCGPFLAVFLVNAAAAALYCLAFSRTQGRRLRLLEQSFAESESRNAGEMERRRRFKEEVEAVEKETVRTLRLYGAVKGLGQALSWEEMVPHIDYAVKQYLGLQDFHLFLIEESSGFQQVLRRGARLQEAPLASPSRKPVLHHREKEVYLEDPLYHGESQIGLLWARLPLAQSEGSEAAVLADAAVLSVELGMGLEKARLFSSLEKLSRIDGLTGVYRRQIFNERLNEEIRRTKIFKTVFSVLIADLDHFKQINDTYGHQTGDAVLKRVGEILRESVYETDFVARYGGEEFVILFPQADPVGVLRKAEAVRARIGQETFISGWNKIGVTISCGAAHFPRDGADAAALIEAADRALYLAKSSGRNRVADASELRGWS